MNAAGFYETSVYSIYAIKVKIKVTLEQVTKAHRGSRSVAVLFILGTRWDGLSKPRFGCFTPGKIPVPIV
jgi:hypothetical protein